MPEIISFRVVSSEKGRQQLKRTEVSLVPFSGALLKSDGKGRSPQQAASSGT
jgi:hypothetical protein